MMLYLLETIEHWNITAYSSATKYRKCSLSVASSFERSAESGGSMLIKLCALSLLNEINCLG